MHIESDHPEGIVTFLFTDIEGSTRLWEEHPEEMRLALARHDHIMNGAILAAGGSVFKTVGDAFCAAFTHASQAVSAAVSAQEQLFGEEWPDGLAMRVRMAIVTGPAEFRDNDYFGRPLNRAARLMAAGHGGQILVAASTQEILRDSVSLNDLGLHRLKDLLQAERIFEINHTWRPAALPTLKTLGASANNLPQQLTSFVGREEQIQTLAAMHRPPNTARLVTLVGVGGTGKTRLALQVAAELLDGNGDGVWFVELASLGDPEHVPQAIANVLSVREESGKPLLQTLSDHLKEKRLLLILDNCEHLLDTCARVADSLLRQCPDVHILATSREQLGIPGEQTYRVPSLAMPAPQNLPPLDSLVQYEAVKLFVERAVLAKPDFAATESNAACLARLCHRLDGIPLAIELAAARTRALPLDQLEARLDDRFRLLKGGSRAAMPRQQTLRALIDWSYDMLNDSEKSLFMRLSVFVGGWKLDAAEAVGAGEDVESWEIADLLTSLVDKSLVVYEEVLGREARYRLLETLQQYAAEKEFDRGQTALTQIRHRDYYLALSEEAFQQTAGANQKEWMDRLELEHDNFRAALEQCRQDPDGGLSGLSMVHNISRFWEVRGFFQEAESHFTEALAHPGAQEPTLERGRALAKFTFNAFRRLDYKRAEQLIQEALTIHRLISNSLGIANALNMLGNIAMYQGHYEAVHPYFEEALHIYRELKNATGEAVVLGNMGNLLSREGKYDAARPYNEESCRLYKAAGDTTRYLHALHNLADVIWQQRHTEEALRHFYETLELCRDTGERLCTANALDMLAEIGVEQGEYVRAVRFCGASDRIRTQLGTPRGEFNAKFHNANVAKAHAALGETAFEQEYAEGTTMDWDEAIDYALNNKR